MDYDNERAYDLGFACGTIRVAIIYLELGDIERATNCLRESLQRLDANNRVRNKALGE